MKYIIELEAIGGGLYKAKGANTLVFDKNGIKNILKPLKTTNVEDTNEYQIGYKVGYEDGAKNQDEVQYKKGYEDGNKIADKNLKEIQDSTYDVAYNKGVEDFENLFVNEHDYEQFFEDIYGSKNPDYNLYDLVAKYGAKKVLDDFKKWQEEKKRAIKESIKVGDEVITSNNYKVIITYINDKYATGIFDDGSSEEFYNETFKKTGRHFEIVEELLNQLRGNKDEKKCFFYF